MNRELQPRTPRADSIGGRTRAYIADNLTLFILSTFIASIGFFAIVSDSKYNSSLGSALGNGFGAGFSFGGITFSIGLAVRYLGRKFEQRKRPHATGHLNVDRFGIMSVSSPVDDHPTQTSSLERVVANQSGHALLLDDLHPWVKSAAKYYWPDGHYRDAVEHAARSVNSETQQKVWSYKDGTDLMNYAFGMEPPKAAEGRRLRFRGDPKTESWRSKMLAAQALGRACYLGLRNIAAHEQKLDWSCQLAFQYLVMFSVLAQWIDECDVTGAV